MLHDRRTLTAVTDTFQHHAVYMHICLHRRLNPTRPLIVAAYCVLLCGVWAISLAVPFWAWLLIDSAVIVAWQQTAERVKAVQSAAAARGGRCARYFCKRFATKRYIYCCILNVLHCGFTVYWTSLIVACWRVRTAVVLCPLHLQQQLLYTTVLRFKSRYSHCDVMHRALLQIHC
jgi:hypothetical protein